MRGAKKDTTTRVFIEGRERRMIMPQDNPDEFYFTGKPRETISMDALTFGTCYICQKDDGEVIGPDMRPYHRRCGFCPQCKSDFTVWESSGKRPIFFRCLKCLNGWEVE